MSCGATQDGGYVLAWISTGQLLFMQAYKWAKVIKAGTIKLD